VKVSTRRVVMVMFRSHSFSKPERDRFPMNPDIGHTTARGDNLLADVEGIGNSDRLHRDVYSDALCSCMISLTALEDPLFTV